MNDPHAITYRDGVYHLFYQANPLSTHWDERIHWGHATSPDLVSWTDHGTALAPADDEVGCWTGCLVQPRAGEAVVLYTSPRATDHELGDVRAAYPLDPDWSAWTPGDVVLRPPDDLGLTMFRDPMVVRERDGWRMVVGGAREHPLVLTFTSTDLRSWRYAAALLDGATHQGSGDGWECPQLLHVDGHDVLLLSVWHRSSPDHHVLATVGRVVGDRFEPVTGLTRLTVGTGLFAPSTTCDAEGRPVAIFWIRDIGDDQWAGAQSVPWLLHVSESGVQLSAHPALRGAAARSPLAHVLSWRPDDGQTLTFWDQDRSPSLTLHRDGARLGVGAASRVESMPLSPGGVVEVVVDGPVAEVSTGVALTAMPIRPAERWSTPTPGAVTSW